MRHLVLIALAGWMLSPCQALAQESISRYTRDFERRAGLFPLYWDAEEARLLLEIPRFDEEFLYLTSLATGLGSNRLGLDRGMIADEFMARFERHGGRHDAGGDVE